MKKIYLIVTALILFVMGILFTLAPNQYMASLGITINDLNLLNVLRSFGGLYLGLVAFVIVALNKKSLIDSVILCVVLVMCGFLIGRIVSLAVDGFPNPKLGVSAVVELVFAIWGLVILRRSTISANIDPKQK